MKFSLFTEIQCPAGASQETRLQEFLQQAELADRLGFRGFWIAEIHCQPQFSLLSAPYVVLGAVAQKTRQLRLGVAVNTLPVHHPVQLAEQAALLDVLSHGRMDFAAGGGHPHSRVYECFDADHKATHAVMEESLAIIRKAWTEETLTFDGRFYQIPEVIVNPKPMQNPPPPFYMATSSLEGVEVGSRIGVNLLLPIHTRTPEQVKQFADTYWKSLEQHGHVRSERELGLLVPIHLANSKLEARARAEEGIMSYFKTIADMRRQYIEWRTRRGEELPERLGRSGAGLPVTYETVCAQHAIVGDSEFAQESLIELAKTTGAAHFLLWFNIGSVPHPMVMESMQQFASEVMPHFGAGVLE
ncbi:MAG TPA: LLM class flavin-dependent oxidoreductase [Candidatus Binatia bacterium]|nr:LLM class flavin-dependent oxidoreductase [Candidatus Binatia bacterium]